MTGSLTIPGSGLNLTGIVSITAAFQPAPTRVEFYVDNILVATSATAAYGFGWDTTKVADGTHIIRAEGVYKSRRTKVQEAVTVANWVTPPPPPPPPTGWPASFTTGPLGTNNLLPLPGTAFLASMFGGYGYTWQQAQAQIASRQQAIGRKYDIIQCHMSGDMSQTWPADQYGPAVAGVASPLTNYSPTQEAVALANGSEYMLAWTPGYTIAQMNAGSADAVWTKMATYLKTISPRRVIIRAFTEFDLPTVSYGIRSDWSTTFTVTPAQFISAWRRMVAKFQAAGATNVGFLWCPTEGAIVRSTLATYYPGDTYVDWVGSDWYNTASWATPLHDGWATFAEMFNYATLGASVWSVYDVYSAGRAVSGQNGITLPPGLPTQKPFMVGETGCVYDPAKGDKGLWFRAVPAALKQMPNLIGVSFYDEDVSAVEANGDWRVDRLASDPAPLAGFVAMAKDPYFVSR